MWLTRVWLRDEQNGVAGRTIGPDLKDLVGNPGPDVGLLDIVNRSIRTERDIVGAALVEGGHEAGVGEAQGARCLLQPHLEDHVGADVAREPEDVNFKIGRNIGLQAPISTQ